MAKASTLYRFQLELADIDRSVYESLDLRVACHPSEDAERLVIRVLARVIAHEEGLEFGRGLSNTEDAALWTRGVHGDIKTWIDVGCPSADRLHRSSKAADSVMVFTHKNESMLRKEWASQPIHRCEDIQVIRFAPSFIKDLAAKLERTMQWYVTLQEGEVSVGDGEQSVDAPLERTTVAAILADS